MNVGAVGGLRNIRNAIRVARHVLENTRHTLLVGTDATKFAVQMGFKLETTKTNGSISVWNNWRNNTCQPNFWMVKLFTFIILNINLIQNLYKIIECFTGSYRILWSICTKTNRITIE